MKRKLASRDLDTAGGPGEDLGVGLRDGAERDVVDAELAAAAEAVAGEDAHAPDLRVAELASVTHGGLAERARVGDGGGRDRCACRRRARPARPRRSRRRTTRYWAWRPTSTRSPAWPRSGSRARHRNRSRAPCSLSWPGRTTVPHSSGASGHEAADAAEGLAGRRRGERRPRAGVERLVQRAERRALEVEHRRGRGDGVRRRRERQARRTPRRPAPASLAALDLRRLHVQAAREPRAEPVGAHRPFEVRPGGTEAVLCRCRSCAASRGSRSTPPAGTVLPTSLVSETRPSRLALIVCDPQPLQRATTFAPLGTLSTIRRRMVTPLPVASKPMLGTTRVSGGQPPKRSIPGVVGHLSSASRIVVRVGVREEVDLQRRAAPPVLATPPTWIV